MTNEKLGELTGELAKRRQEQERAAGQEDQHNIEAYQEKLAQAGQRVAKLEKQVEIQRQRLGQYYQRFYPSSLAVASQKLMALGAAMNYKILLKYDSQCTLPDNPATSPYIPARGNPISLISFPVRKKQVS